MPIDPDALMQLVQSAERAGVLEQVGKIGGDILLRIANEPDLDYEMFFGVIANRLNFKTMSKGVKMFNMVSNLLNPFIRLAANDFIMMMVAIPLSMPFVQKIGAGIVSKVAIFVLKGKMPGMKRLSLKKA